MTKVITNILPDFNIEVGKLIDVYDNNSGTLAIAKFGNFKESSEHLETHCHFVSENYLNWLTIIVMANSEDNWADILIKASRWIEFKKFWELLNKNWICHKFEEEH